MIVHDIERILEAWAPKRIAWERDNVGLQVGSQTARVKGILVCLDVTEQTVVEAQRHGANVIISHHPLLFRPLRTVDLSDSTGRCVNQLLRRKINLFSAHTNLDFTRGGTSFALAERLGLRHVDFLRKSYRMSKKVVTFVPSDHTDRVAEAMSNAGGGTIGNYSACSFRSQGTGAFKGNKSSSPTVGRRNVLEQTKETRLEMIVDETRLNATLQALLATHPYEEVAYDVYPLENVTTDYGMGIIGELVRPMRLQRFLAHVKKSLKSSAIRHTHGGRPNIRRVAACGGSGSDLTDEAVHQGADAFITADVKYHSFHNASGRITLIDAGHYETERPVVDAIVSRLRNEIKHQQANIPVHATRISSNPIAYN